MVRLDFVAVEEITMVCSSALYHFHPGTKCLSIACTGCNFRCLNCQNHEISQVAPTDVAHYDLSPEAVVDICLEHHCPGIAYTYTEPLTYLEYVTDTARLAHEKGLWNILVTAGYVCQQPLSDLLIPCFTAFSTIVCNISGGHSKSVAFISNSTSRSSPNLSFSIYR